MKKQARINRHLKIRKKIMGSSARPRLAVFRSNLHIYAQIIDDVSGKTLVSESDLKLTSGTKKERSYEVGKKIAAAALKKNIKRVIYDRGGFLFHGRIADLARGAKEGELEF